eukprot:gnl/MRDRNA2_/MRDRNA2_120936_c0_seq1.p1 gnl/MRDRNA2_/MRDRNA2_120936_c0~~gnl/MRDRNA2_/MRDRNA2_120936_c0_seq1.p1  ORF type:complete len:643 (+),score=133.30 gnl/MRDRNA2_/MRDRNA2_120936_c0_seq1:61-1989(+)
MSKVHLGALAAIGVTVPLTVVALKWRASRARRRSAEKSSEEVAKGESSHHEAAMTQDDDVPQEESLDVQSLSEDQLGILAEVAAEAELTTEDEEPMSAKTLQVALEECDKVDSWNSCASTVEVGRGEDDTALVCYSFSMRHFACKAYLIGGGRDEGSKHLKLQTVFEDSRRELGEEQRYFIANEWNASKRYTRLKCGTSGVARYGLFTLEYDVLVPAEAPHDWGLQLLSHTLRMWYMSMVTCVMHIVERHEMPFATHEMITANTLTLTIREEDEALAAQVCPICLETFRVGDKVRRLPCLHVFHATCECNIDRHLVCDKNCPSCKTPIDIMERSREGQQNVDPASKDDVVYNFPSDNQSEPAQLVDASTSTEVEDTAAATAAAGASASPAATVSAEVQVQTDDVSPEADGAVVQVAQVEGIIEQSLALGSSLETIRLPNLPQASTESAHEGVAAELERVVEQGMRVQEGMAQHLPQPEAEELHRAVQSLQTRWNQMQDVVAGMQQMLRIIEESRALAGQLRNQSRANAASDEEEQPTQTDDSPGQSAPSVQNSHHDHLGAAAPSARTQSVRVAPFQNLWRSFIGAGTLGTDAQSMARSWRARVAAQEAQAATQETPRVSGTPSEVLQPEPTVSSSSDNTDGY